MFVALEQGCSTVYHLDVKLSDVKVNEGGWEAKFTPLPQLGYVSSVEGITWRICQQKQQTTLEKFTKNITNHSNPIDLKIGNTSSKNDSKSMGLPGETSLWCSREGLRVGWMGCDRKEGSWWPQIWGAIFWDSWYIWSLLTSCFFFWVSSIKFGGFNPIWDHGQRSRMDDYCRNVCFGRCIVFCLAPGPLVDIPCWRECEIIIQILIYGWGIWGNLSPYNKMARYLEPNQIASQLVIRATQPKATERWVRARWFFKL